MKTWEEVNTLKRFSERKSKMVPELQKVAQDISDKMRELRHNSSVWWDPNVYPTPPKEISYSVPFNHVEEFKKIIEELGISNSDKDSPYYIEECSEHTDWFTFKSNQEFVKIEPKKVSIKEEHEAIEEWVSDIINDWESGYLSKSEKLANLRQAKYILLDGMYIEQFEEEYGIILTDEQFLKDTIKKEVAYWRSVL